MVSGREVRFFPFASRFLSQANKESTGSGAPPNLFFSSLLRGHVDGEVAEERKDWVLSSYAGGRLPYPWRSPGSTGVAPCSPPRFFFWFKYWVMKRLLLLLVFALALVAGAVAAGGGHLAGSDEALFPLLAVTLCFALHTGCHCGGGDGVEAGQSFGIWRLGSCSSSSTTKLQLCRPLISPENGGRWAVSMAPSMTLLVEGRPFGADALVGARSSSSSRLHAIGEAVLLRFGVQLVILWHLRRLKTASRRSDGPKWFVPGDGRDVSLLRQFLGPDCNLNSRFRVLQDKVRDWLVISVLWSPFLNSVLLLHI